MKTTRTKSNPISNYKLQGFTLIELLVVVAIIGILASVVLGALNGARTKGSDSAVQSSLTNAVSQGEVFYNTNTAAKDSYTNVCTGTVAAQGALGVGSFVLAAAKANGLVSVGNDNVPAASTSVATCNDTANAWAAEVPLKSKGANQVWCVDSTGKSKQEGVSIGSGTACN